MHFSNEDQTIGLSDPGRDGLIEAATERFYLFMAYLKKGEASK